MNQEITAILKNRLSEFDFRKIDLDEPVDKYYFYGDYPIKRLRVSNDDYITYIINYYQCHQNDSRTLFEQKNFRIDIYRDKYHVVNYEKLKSQEKELFDSLLNDTYFKEKIYNDMYQEFKMNRLKMKLDID